jgi:glycosyltransferase involved in cell wall biosynthesis
MRLRVLLSAYACEPHRGSEAGIGWNWVRQAARFHEVWVMTRSNNREAIEAAASSLPPGAVHWIYYDLPRSLRFWKRGARGMRVYYYLWQIGIWRLARRLRATTHFDLVHHVTIGNYWTPSFLALLPTPFIWGPVGGGESAPRPFYATFGVRGRIFEHTRDILRRVGELDPFLRTTSRRARVGIATTPETAATLARLGARRVRVLSHVGLPRDEITELTAIPFRREAPVRFVSIGRLLHWKGYHLGIRAFARLAREDPTTEYWIIGDGPDRRRLEAVARSCGVSDRVQFLGVLPRERVMRALEQCDVLVHPSLHDSGGYVCVEAMAAGRPVIALGLGGPALLVSPETGFLIPARDPEQVQTDLADALAHIARDPLLRRRLSEAARQAVCTRFDWDRKGDVLSDLYGN